ncbi:MAG: hypothetical protein HC887_07260, partial [Desulfobacteraceae bacterium]|nr:hypothetical protein [Desulfobacteraceae bacterium]
NRLLIVIHHLVVDGVSWRILLEDIETAYRQSLAGKAVVLPEKSDSFKRWAEKMTRIAIPKNYSEKYHSGNRLNLFRSKQLQEITTPAFISKKTMN